MTLITIDGPAASGKGTLAKRLASAFDLPHLDTGLLYRIVALDLIQGGKDINDAKSAVQAAERLDVTRYPEEALRARDMGEAASVVSAIPELRRALLKFQQDFAGQPGGAVLDGRDCGSIIAPGADQKFFVTAKPEVRAHRRTIELIRRGEPAVFESVLADIRKRDERDSGRSSAPLVIPADAVVIDTSDMDIATMMDAAMHHLRDQRPSCA